MQDLKFYKHEHKTRLVTIFWNKTHRMTATNCRKCSKPFVDGDISSGKSGDTTTQNAGKVYMFDDLFEKLEVINSVSPQKKLILVIKLIIKENNVLNA